MPPGGVRHTSWCAIYNDPPMLRDTSCCNCGAIPREGSGRRAAMLEKGLFPPDRPPVRPPPDELGGRRKPRDPGVPDWTPTMSVQGQLTTLWLMMVVTFAVAVVALVVALS